MQGPKEIIQSLRISTLGHISQATDDQFQWEFRPK